MTILDVEVELETALAQARDRWAVGRVSTIEGRATGGGRFTPRGAITSMYPNGTTTSSCNTNAVDFFTDARAASFDEIKLLVATPDAETKMETYRRILGKYATTKPTYLAHQ